MEAPYLPGDDFDILFAGGETFTVPKSMDDLVYHKSRFNKQSESL